MDNLVPITIAFLGAAFGAYFAVLKSKKEKLWQEKFETLKELVCDLDIISSKFTKENMDAMGISASTDKERHTLDSGIDKAKIRVSTNISKLQLLFKNADLNLILEERMNLNSAFIDLYNSSSDYQSNAIPEYIEHMQAIASVSEKLKTHVIALAQLKCI
jgi:hypothetical protein